MKTSKIIEQNKKSIVLLDIVIPQEGGKSKVSIRGTGFIISSDGKFVTCAHVYEGIPEDERQYLGVKVPMETDKKGLIPYKSFKVELIDIDKENDIALMSIMSEENDFKAIQEIGDSEDVQEGEEALFVGYPLALELLQMGFGITMSANECIISSVKRRKVNGSLHFFMVDTHINNGLSGSPLFSRDTGRVVGVASGKISQKVGLPEGRVIDISANMGICRPINYAKNLIEKNK